MSSVSICYLDWEFWGSGDTECDRERAYGTQLGTFPGPWDSVPWRRAQVILSHQEMFKTRGQGNVYVVANPVTPVTVSHSGGCSNCSVLT